MGFVRTIHLAQWARTTTARYKLGELLRTLIHASIPLGAIRRIRFLANESSELSGWDGVLDCDSQVPWVPDGTSVWELGTNGNPTRKIRNDFTGRLNSGLPFGWQRQTTIYVAVTLGKLDDLTSLESELKQGSPWHDVKVCDAQALEEWIERVQSVATWLQEQGIGPSPSIHTLQWEWREWAEGTEPRVSTKLLLTDREEATRNLLDALRDSGGVNINVRADAPDEAVAFVFASLETAEAEFREHLLARSVVVRTKNDVSSLCESAIPLNVILRPPATEDAQKLIRARHTVISAIGNSSPTQKVDIRLRRPLRSRFAAALVEMGRTKEQAELEAKACGASVPIWRIWNRLQHADLSSDIPDWAKETHARLVVPAVLLGGWSDRFEGDKEAIKRMTGMEFGEYRDHLHPFISQDNPLLVKIGDVWVITAPAAAFALTINHMTFGHLTNLSEIVSAVFSEPDPTIDLDPDDRPHAALRTEGMRHSTWLRDGLAESLLRIAVIGERLEETGAIPWKQTCQSFVDGLISGLPGLREDWRLLASLRHQLPVLAEAAPIPFLEALEQLLQGQPEKIAPIFKEGNSLFGHPLYPYFLWALETLAWEPMYLARVGLILCGLAKIDPGGQIATRPINSLKEIFLAWHPGTSASLDLRLQALDIILEREPEIGWTLLNALMPRPHEISHPTQEPIWRDFGRSERAPVTRMTMWEAFQEYLGRAVLYAGQKPNRWKDLIGIYSNVPEYHQRAIEDGLEKLAKTELPREDRKSIWETLRELVSRHRGFLDTSWALPGDQLDRLEGLMGLFAPTDHIDQISWLFNEHFPQILFPRRDHERMELELKKLRAEALKGLWQEGGITALISLVDRVDLPHLVAYTLLDQLTDEIEALDILERTNQGSANQRMFAKFLSGLAYKRFGNGWTDLVLSRASVLRWPADAIVNAIENYPDSLETFELVSSLGPEVELRYWGIRSGWIHLEEGPVFLLAIKKLMWAGRALDAVALASHNLGLVEASEILRVLDQALQELNQGKSRGTTGDLDYEIEELFKWLRTRTDIDKSALAQREYGYLPLLTMGLEKKHLALHDLLAKDPSFFVEVLCDLYKPSSFSQEEAPISEMSRIRAELAFALLRSWDRPPGIQEDGRVDGQQLREWVEAARRLAFEKDRSDVADHHIGYILFHYPPDPDDSAWPHVEVRRLLEDLRSEEVESGIEMEQFNSRGIVSKEVFEGGDQERELAKQWRNWAQIIGTRWPRTRSLLERIAASWDLHARQEGQRAEKDRLRSG